MEQLALFFAEKPPVQPSPPRVGPALWVARLLILREPRVAEDTVIQDIRLRRGLNVLWAPPTPPAQGDAPANRLTGHSAGKTTFCRLIRYLLGETRFGTGRTQDRIRGKLESGWVVGEIVVGDERWTVGRPFARGIHPFAARGALADGPLEVHGGYQEFLAAVASAVTAPLPVKSLPHARAPITWELVLTWLARDQEARFADLLDWRAPASESESPSPIAADRSVVVRALLDLMSDEESALQQQTEALSQKREQLRAGAPPLQARAAEDRRRLARLLLVTEEQVGSGPLFTELWLKGRRAALDEMERGLSERAAELTGARDAAAQASEEVGARGERLREAEDRLSRQRGLLRRHDASAAGNDNSAQAAPAAPRGESLLYCNVHLALAEEGGCPFAARHSHTDDERRAPAGGEDALEQQREVVAELERDIEAARAALNEARARRDELQSAYLRLSAALDEERAGLHRGRAALDEVERFGSYAEETQAALEEIEQGARRLTEDLGKVAERRTARRREHAEARGRLERCFDEVVRALLGPSFTGRVSLVRGQLELQVTDRGERTGAAMETIKLLAFDLAALALRLEGHGSFPGFLIHDGPREADLAEGIYEQLFRYAADLEKRAQGQEEPAFQYIITTTGAPPEELRRAPWLLSPTLDASRPEGRLLKEDL